MLKIKPNHLRQILIDIKDKQFMLDGCYCGDYEYQLDENLYLGAYRSCYKSGNTPDGFRWKLHGVSLYRKTEDLYGYGEGELADLQLDEKQKEIIERRLRRVSILQTGGTETKYIGCSYR